MRMTEFLALSRIKVPLVGSSAHEIVHELVGVLPLPDPDRRGEVLAAVLDNEQATVSGIGQGVAVCYGLAPIDEDLLVAFGIPGSPVECASADGKPAELVFLVVGNEARRGLSVRALARIARLLHHEQFRVSLGQCLSGDEVMEVIRCEEALHRI